MDNGRDLPAAPLTALTETVSNHGAHPPDLAALQTAAEQWAVYCLRTHTDVLLTLGIQISIAIAQYVTEAQAAA